MSQSINGRQGWDRPCQPLWGPWGPGCGWSPGGQRVARQGGGQSPSCTTLPSPAAGLGAPGFLLTCLCPPPLQTCSFHTAPRRAPKAHFAGTSDWGGVCVCVLHFQKVLSKCRVIRKPWGFAVIISGFSSITEEWGADVSRALGSCGSKSVHCFRLRCSLPPTRSTTWATSGEVWHEMSIST